MIVSVFALLLTGCVKDTVNKTADKINQVADKTREIADKANEISDTVNEVSDKAEQLKDKISEMSDLTELKNAWNVVSEEVSENLESNQLEGLKVQLEEVLNVSITQIKKVGDELMITFDEGKEVTLNFSQSLEPQIEKFKEMMNL